MFDFWPFFIDSNFLQIYFLCFWFTCVWNLLLDFFDRFDIHFYIFVSEYMWYDLTLSVIFNVFYFIYSLQIYTIDLDFVVYILFVCVC